MFQLLLCCIALDRPVAMNARVVRLSVATLLSMLVFSTTAQAQSREPSLEQLQMEHLLEQASRAFEKHDLSIEQISADFKYRCLRAIGDTKFCECLVKKRPYVLRFEQYIGISSRTKAELAHDTLGDFSREIVNKVFEVRDECVGL